MPWVKGQSGNVGGAKTRPLGIAVQERAAKHSDKALNALVKILQDKDEPASARVAAAGQLLDRAFGKAPQDITVKGQVESHIIHLIQGLDSRPQDIIPMGSVVDATQPSLPAPRNGVEVVPGTEPNDTNGLEP